MKSYQIKPGLIISGSIGCITSFRIILPLRHKVVLLKNGGIYEPGWPDMLQTFLIISLFAFCCWLIHQYLLQTRFSIKAIDKKWIKCLIGIVCCVLLSNLFEFVQGYLYTASFEEQPEPHKRLFFMGLRGFIVGGFQLFMVYYIAALKEAQQARVEIERLKKENLEARLNLLKQQISPHFLFNSLSTLKTIAPDHHTRQYIMQLSNVYRYLLNYSDNHMATLQNELAFTNSYLYILKERFENALQVNIQVPEQVLQKNIPPLALQILIENAIKHNVISADEPLHIDISSDQDAMLVVQNNLQPKLSFEKGSGKGLQNISDRYHLLSGKQIDIIQTRDHFIVKLPLL